jgi:hypothetical protein
MILSAMREHICWAGAAAELDLTRAEILVFLAQQAKLGLSHREGCALVLI